MFKLFFAFLMVLATSILPGQQLDSVIKSLSADQIDTVLDVVDINKNPLVVEPKVGNEDQETLINVTSKEPLNSENIKFGYNFLSTTPSSIDATGDLPLPNDYKISLRDQLSIILSGARNSIFDLTVNLDGTILFPEIGSISVVGKTFGELKEILESLVTQTYIGVRVDISLKNLSAKKISIVGAVNSPGTYIVNPYSTITSALAYSGGVSQIGTLRKIKLIKTNGETVLFDLYRLLIDGDRSNDVTVESGDVIVVDAANKFINLSGGVVRPAIYEILENETLKDLIKFGLGFKENANKSNISLNIINSDFDEVNTKVVQDLSTSLNSVLSANVFVINTNQNSTISVSGAIKEPGFYSLKQFETLEALINKLDFVDVYPWLAVLEQFDDKNLIKSSILFSLKDSSTYKDIKLLPNSKVFFINLFNKSYIVEPQTQNLINDYQLTLSHKDNTYSLPVFGKFSVDSFVKFLGLDMSEAEHEATYISPLDDIIIVENYKNMEFVAKKFHTLSFRSPVNDLISVLVTGAVNFPGEYILNSNSTLEDLYELIGGFKNEAFLDGIIFIRSSIRDRQLKAIEKTREDLNEAILSNIQKGNDIGDIAVVRALSENIEYENLGRISGDFKPNSKASKKTILLNGDNLIIPKNPNVINVLGEVLNPTAFNYTKKSRVSSAISAAGGFKEFAAKNRVYVIRANGLVKQVKRHIFARDLRLEPGDSVIVPRKIATDNPAVRALVPITQILSDLAFSAAAIDSLRN